MFSLYLLLAIGFKGGYEISKSGINPEIAFTLLAAIVMASAVPIYSFFVLRIKLDAYNAAAMRMTVPEANPSLYVSMALALTFPFNIIVGIPLYFNIIKAIGV